MSKKHWESKLASEKEKISTISSEVDEKKRILKVFGVLICYSNLSIFYALIYITNSNI